MGTGMIPILVSMILHQPVGHHGSTCEGTGKTDVFSGSVDGAAEMLCCKPSSHPLNILIVWISYFYCLAALRMRSPSVNPPSTADRSRVFDRRSPAQHRLDRRIEPSPVSRIDRRMFFAG